MHFVIEFLVGYDVLITIHGAAVEMALHTFIDAQHLGDIDATVFHVFALVDEPLHVNIDTGNIIHENVPARDSSSALGAVIPHHISSALVAPHHISHKRSVISEFSVVRIGDFAETLPFCFVLGLKVFALGFPPASLQPVCAQTIRHLHEAVEVVQFKQKVRE